MPRKVFQIHPSQFCNYTCLHCYSSSSPKHKSRLGKELIIGAIEEAAALGYERLSVSGGEPLLYPDLNDLLEAAKEAGMRTSLVTNGSFPKKKYKGLSGLVDTIGISLDGDQPLHNEIRQNPSAFEKVDRCLDFAPDIFENVCIVYALSDLSWETLPDMLCYAQTKGITGFQIHPLEAYGRANESNLSLSTANLKRAYLMTNMIGCQFTFPIHFDVLSSVTAKANMVPRTFEDAPADILDLLVMNELGEVLPYTYGLDEKWMIADLKRESLAHGWNTFESSQLQSFTAWCEDVVENLDDSLVAPSSIFSINKELVS